MTIQAYRMLKRGALLASIGVALLGLTSLGGCKQEKVQEEPAAFEGPDYGRPLPPGGQALRKVTDPARMPDLAEAFRNRDVFLRDAIDQSRRWFRAPSSKQFYPFEQFTHDQQRASLMAMIDLLENSSTPRAFVDAFLTRFDVYESVGYDGEGVVLFTGYYSPIFRASRTPTSQFSFPLYTRPEDLVTDPVTGEPQGRRRPDGTIEPYPTRREIEEGNLLAGLELVWLEDPLSAFIVHVNGSAKLRLRDGSIMYIGYAGKTDRPYYGLGQSMLGEGLLSPNELSLANIRRAYKRNPEQVRELMYNNESFVFFTEYSGGNWPAGSLGVRVTQETTLATDKKVYPRGGPVMVDTQAVTFSRGRRPFVRFMLDQDTGGAINAPGRGDIFMGIGPSAEILAGGQYAEGRLYYFFLKPEFIEQYLPNDQG